MYHLVCLHEVIYMCVVVLPTILLQKITVVCQGDLHHGHVNGVMYRRTNRAQARRPLPPCRARAGAHNAAKTPSFAPAVSSHAVVRSAAVIAFYQARRESESQQTPPRRRLYPPFSQAERGELASISTIGAPLSLPHSLPPPRSGNDDCSTRYSVQKNMVCCSDCAAIAAFPAAITCSQNFYA